MYISYIYLDHFKLLRKISGTHLTGIFFSFFFFHYPEKEKFESHDLSHVIRQFVERSAESDSLLWTLNLSIFWKKKLKKSYVRLFRIVQPKENMMEFVLLSFIDLNVLKQKLKKTSYLRTSGEIPPFPRLFLSVH